MTGGAEDGLGRGGQRGRNWDNCNRITVKYVIINNIMKAQKRNTNIYIIT